jgi:hypothetical protein
MGELLKMNKNFFVSKRFLVLAFIVVALFTVTMFVISAPIPVPGDPAWDKSYSTNDKIPKLTPTKSAKDDASGDKIPSNAHSADYPGVYFYWDDKQKDDGVFLVKKEIFDLFDDGYFYLIAKNSNNYWDYLISPSTGYEIKPGVFAYRIPKQFQWLSYNPNNGKTKEEKEDLKNINMVFIDGKYKDAYFIIQKKWFDECGDEILDEDIIAELLKKLSFQGGYKLGENTVKITNYKDALNGKTITVIENPIKGFTTKKNPQTIIVKWDDKPKKIVLFENQKQWAYIKINKNWLGIEENIIPKPENIDAKFDIVNSKTDKIIHEDVGPGIYKVKEGEYRVIEKGIAGFKLYTVTVDITKGDKVDNGKAIIIIDAGDTKCATFGNIEDPPTPGIIELMKLVKKGECGELVVFDDENELWNKDVDLIWFDLYEADAAGVKTSGVKQTKQIGSNGIIRFDGLIPGDWYIIEERFDLSIADKYEAVAPIHIQAWTNSSIGDFVFNPVFNGDGIVSKTDPVISSPNDNDLKMYVCSNNYDAYFNSAASSPILNVNGSEFYDGNNLWNTWVGAMKDFNYDTTLGLIKLADGSTPDFIWNAEDFGNREKARDGDTVIFEKTFNLYDEITDDTVPFYITADNAFILFVNGRYVGHSKAFMNYQNTSFWNETNMRLDKDILEVAIGTRHSDTIVADSDKGDWADVYTWEQTYEYDIKNYLTAGTNKITVVAVNQAQNLPGNMNYFENPKANPGGVIFGCEITSQSEKYRFINKPVNPEPQSHVLISNPLDTRLINRGALHGSGDIFNVNKSWTAWGYVDEYYGGADYLKNFDGTGFNFNTMKNIDLDGNYAEYIWNNDKFDNIDLALSGDVAFFEKTFDDVGIIDRTNPINLYIGGDNAFLVFINGEFAFQSDAIVTPYGASNFDSSEIAEVLGNLSDEYINCQDFKKLYVVDVKGLLKDGVPNTFTIICVNENADPNGTNYYNDNNLWSDGITTASPNEYGTWSVEPNQNQNPAAFIFACKFSSVGPCTDSGNSISDTEIGYMFDALRAAGFHTIPPPISPVFGSLTLPFISIPTITDSSDLAGISGLIDIPLPSLDIPSESTEAGAEDPDEISTDGEDDGQIENVDDQSGENDEDNQVSQENQGRQSSRRSTRTRNFTR